MREFRLSHQANDDVETILAWTSERFDEAAERRYALLVAAGLTDIAEDAFRAGSGARPDLGRDVRTWHLRGSLGRARARGAIVRTPRHVLLYRPIDQSRLLVGRVLHEAMDATRHRVIDEDWE